MPNQQESTTLRLAKAFAIIVAMGVSFMLTPQIHDPTVGWVEAYAAAHYSGFWAAQSGAGYFALLAAMVFFGCALLLNMALQLIIFSWAVALNR